MVDTLSVEDRSRTMASIRGKDTIPERKVRSALHGLGYRYRLHVADLPGKPDIVFPNRMKLVFVHGCFWHSHQCRGGRNRPVTNVDYWSEKLHKNVERDRRNIRRLRRLGWGVLVVWECQTRDMSKVVSRLLRFLEG